MGAEVTSNQDVPCDSSGGVDTHYAFAVKDAAGASTITTYTVDEATGTVTDLVLALGQKAFTFNVEQGTGTFTSNSIGEKASGSQGYDHTSTMVFFGNTGDQLVNIHAMNIGRHAIIHALADGTFELLHMENGGKGQSNRTPGTAYSDMNGTTMTMTSQEKLYAPKIDAALVALLLIPLS